MAFAHGKFASIKMDNAAGTLFDLSAISNNIDYPESYGTGETTSFQQTAKTYLVGLTDATLSVGGTYDNTLAATIRAAVASVVNGTNASLTIEYGPQGTTTGKPKYTFEAIPTGLSFSTPVAGVGTFKLDFQRTGATTDATY
jgi:hypothetical protein